jgi:NADH-quinone oxidoreductase subunit E
MSMFSFPADMNKNEMMKPMTAMTDWTKAADLQVAPMMVYPLGAAAVATAVGFGMAGQMTGLMMGAMQAAMRSQGSVMGSKPDLSWMVPTLAEDLAPEEFDESPAAEASNPDANAKSADIVALKPAAKAAVAAPDAEAKAKPTARKPATVKTAAAKAKASNTKPTAAKGTATAPETEKTDPSPVEALSGDGAVAVVEKLKSDANVAAAAASEAGAADKATDAEPAKVIEPEDFRRPTEIEKPEALTISSASLASDRSSSRCSTDLACGRLRRSQTGRPRKSPGSTTTCNSRAVSIAMTGCPRRASWLKGGKAA